VEAPGVESGVGGRSFDTSRAVSDARTRELTEPEVVEAGANDVSRSLETAHCSIEVSQLRHVLSELDAGHVEAARNCLTTILELVRRNAECGP
jgi:hypothetical protein